MRPLLVLPLLVLTLACSSKLERAKAEEMLRGEYPVVVPVNIPEEATAEKGSSLQVRMAAMKENLDRTGWFESTVKTQGGQEAYTFRLKPDAPKLVKAAPQGFKVPAAEATFVRALKMEPTREGARVMYEIRLEKPTAQFSLLQAQLPEIKIGQTKVRHAVFAREKGGWKLVETDEAFKKAD